MKKVLMWLCCLMAMAGVCLLFSETEATAPMSDQIWLWAKGIGLIVVAMVIGSFIEEEEGEA